MSYTVTNTSSGSTITVHGRSSLSIPYQAFAVASDGTETQTDVSSSDFYFEVHGKGIRKLLSVNPNDALGKVIELTRAEVESLGTSASKFALIDESNPSKPLVMWEGGILRNGYTGAPA